MVPKEIQRRVYAAYRSPEYREGDTTEHSLAVYDAIKAVRSVRKGPGGDLYTGGLNPSQSDINGAIANLERRGYP